jgi:para-aminobenzoate synthetase component 1
MAATMHPNIESVVCYLEQDGPVVWLDSRMEDHPANTYSWIAARPAQVFSAKDDDEVWNDLQKSWDKNPDWWFGYLGYDLKNGLEDLNSENRDLVEAPDIWLMNPEILIRIDKRTGSWEWLRGQEARQEILDGAQEHSGNYSADTFQLSELIPYISEKEYLQAIQKVQQDIYEGRYYELNFTYPLVGKYQGDALAWYEHLQNWGPVPFGAYLRFDDWTVCCLSPERFLQKTGNHLVSQPIKGTRGRGESDQEDKAIRMGLMESVKDKAENLMIVDLVRNDLNRIAEPNTVHVDPLFEIQSFRTVHQMVSTIHARVPESINPWKIIAACFPMGSMTGAPKIEVMKRIEELETYRRGIYSGAIGYVDPAGNFDFNVVIRSALLNKRSQHLIYPVGGAITSDSDPQEEWKETIIKARALAQQR